MDTRHLKYSFWTGGNFSNSNNSTDFDSNLERPQDVSVDSVLTSLYFNSIVFVMLMASYEILRRVFPAVYSSRKRISHARPDTQNGHLPEAPLHEDATVPDPNGTDYPKIHHERHASLTSLPDDRPLDWIGPVFGVPWSKVRRIAGLDGYFFLRYIRMNVRITAVSTFWFFLILVPIYATGSSKEHSAEGWYHLSAANIPRDGWRMWIPCLFAYLFSAFVCFVVKQEYRHFLDLRQDFLARGNMHVDPQHHHSLEIENIPYELRSDRALKEYFEKMFPGRVHSASVVLNLPELEDASVRCMRTCRRLEKSIAFLHATGNRPTHVVGRGRISCLGIELQPLDCNCTASQETLFVENDMRAERPKRGTRVDSISYYAQELAADSRSLFQMQKRKSRIAESGNQLKQVDNWLDKAVRQASEVANTILEDSIKDNHLTSPYESFDEGGTVPQAESMTSRYGSFSQATLSHRAIYGRSKFDKIPEERKEPLVCDDEMSDSTEDSDFPIPFSRDSYQNRWRRWAGRLGLDFAIAGLKLVNKQLDVALEEVVGATMSSTGYVTFLDLSSTTCAASAPLTVKANVLDVSVAPEPRDIIWKNAHISKRSQLRRGNFTNFFLFLGVILWSFPLAAIQAFAKAEFLAQIPGMEWILTFHGGTFTNFMNGYLPVVALLCLILILPLIFEYVAVSYEHRKTYSDVQSSMLSRYFYYQLANIYVSVTAGSILKSLSDILDHPSNILQLLGDSLPTMVGYFDALLVTKIMAGLPMIFLRFGALSRMLFLKTLSNEKKMTQRELDAVYRLENVQYGWEFPTQLLVVVIVFTYAIICPVILPFGLLYFLGALLVYKKQVLYVYSPVYESGGAMFPVVVQRTLFGLVCGQMTFIGYVVTRGCYYQPICLFPLPIGTIWAMNFFRQNYADPSTRLSLERARECDRLSSSKAATEEDGLDSNIDRGVELRRTKFDRKSYRQPVLTELATEPEFYRSGFQDDETFAVRKQLQRINRYIKEATLEHNDGLKDALFPM
jgi:hypothetical protein